MKIAYFDCFSGISGDMVLGALIHAGLDPAQLEAHWRKLPLEGWHSHVSVEHRHSIAATRLEIHAHPHELAESAPHSHDDHEHAHHGHSHDHAHHEQESHSHPHERSHDRGHAHPHRGLTEILDLIARSDLPEPVKETASRIFDRLADAEANAHRIPKEEIHFHEVGAVDAILDIVGAAVGVHLLGIEEVYASPLPVGRGFARCDHGLMPLPVPGTMELLKGVPVYPTEIGRELITPTGAAILTTLAKAFGGIPEMTVEAVGYGAGKRDLPEQPNMLRVVIGKKKARTILPGS